MNYAVAVLDIGKTNKKVAIYDENMNPLTVGKRKIETVPFSRQGLNPDVEDVETVEAWFLEQLAELAGEYPIKAISVTTHGAAVVCVGPDGKPALPVVAYTNEVDESVHTRFHEAMGSADTLQSVTATAEIKPLINIGKLLWFQKETWPREFEDVANILSPAVAAATGLSPDTKVTLGIHDSNSSLIPYVISQDKDFVLNSTGTWCVAMHPVEKVSFTPAELGKIVYFNLSFQEKPVKTSILMGGLEYAVYTDALMAHHKRSDRPNYMPDIYSRILAEKDTFILPAIVPGTGQFPNSRARVVHKNETYPAQDIVSGSRWPSAFDSYEEGFALAIQTRIALERVGPNQGTEVFIEGGFRRNPSYGALPGALLPENPLYLTALEEATRFGAALCGKAMLDKVPVESLGRCVNLDKHPVVPARLDGLEDYVRAFLEYLES